MGHCHSSRQIYSLVGDLNGECDRSLWADNGRLVKDLLCRFCISRPQNSSPRFNFLLMEQNNALEKNFQRRKLGDCAEVTKGSCTSLSERDTREHCWYADEEKHAKAGGGAAAAG